MPTENAPVVPAPQPKNFGKDFVVVLGKQLIISAAGALVATVVTVGVKALLENKPADN